MILIERAQGSLPSTSEENPMRDGKEHCKAITLRSGREIAAPGPALVIVKDQGSQTSMKQRLIQRRKMGINPN